MFVRSALFAFSLALPLAALADGPPDATLARCANPASGLPALKNATVRIEAGSSVGSGVLIQETGWILTAAHVVDPDASIRVNLSDGRQLPGEVVRWVPGADAALIKVDGQNLPCAAVAPTPEAGDTATIVGSPLGEALSWTVTRGIVSAVREHDGERIVQTDAAVNPGNSGGPLFVGDGVAGVVSTKLSGGVEGIAFAVSSDTALQRMNVRMDASGDDVLPWIGSDERVVNTTVSMDNRPVETGFEDTDAPKNPCRGFRIEEDAFSGTRTFREEVWDLYRVQYDGSEASTVSLFYPLGNVYRLSDMAHAVQGEDGELGQVDVRIRLEDGTTITLADVDFDAETINAYGARFVASADLEQDVVQAIASSPPTVIQWELADQKFTVSPSKRQRNAYYRRAFSCLYTQMASL